MSYASKGTRPGIKILLSAGSFNLLIQILKDNIADEYASEGYISEAEDFIAKINRYCQLYTDKDGQEIVDIRLFDEEAEDLIYQLLFKCAGLQPTADYFTELKIKQEGGLV
jgi:hypothetical protein